MTDSHRDDLPSSSSITTACSVDAANSDQQRSAAQLSRRRLLTAGGALGAALLMPAVRAAEGVPQRLRQLGIVLQATPAPVANYVPWIREDNFVYLSGQLPFRDGELLWPGKVPTDVSVEEGRAAARQCGINLVSALNSACEGDLNRVRRCLRIDGYVASSAGFDQQSTVINGVSDLMVEVFADAGRHSRTAVGVNELPLNACVEVAAVFLID